MNNVVCVIYYLKFKTVQISDIKSFFALIPQIASLLAKIKKGDSLNVEQIPSLVTQNGKLSNQIIEGFEYSIEMVGK